MRGADEQPGSMFSYFSLEDRVPQDHPLRAIRHIADRALERLSPTFGTLYVKFGRPSIPPEKLLRARRTTSCGYVDCSKRPHDQQPDRTSLGTALTSADRVARGGEEVMTFVTFSAAC